MFSGLHFHQKGEKEVRIITHSSLEEVAFLLVFVCRRWSANFIFLLAMSAPAQEALQNMQAGDTAAAARSRQMQPQASPVQDYTFKEGDFRLMVTPSMGLEWNDNVNLAQTNVMDDYIVTPAVGITASYPFSKANLLYIDFTAGYAWYLKHPKFSSFQLNSSSGTGLSFDIAIKDFTINLHDWINYTQGSSQIGPGSLNNTASATIANTATFGTFQNTIGLSGSWDLNQVTLSLGYDHQNILATSGQFDQVNHSSEMLFARAYFQVHPQVTVGLESTAAFTAYEQNTLNDNSAYTVGPYVEFQPGKVLTLTARAGYSIEEFQNTSTNIQTSSQNSWYASLTLTHQPTKSISYSLAVGREVQLGIVSDLIEDWYVLPGFAPFKYLGHIDDEGLFATGLVFGTAPNFDLLAIGETCKTACA